MVALFEANKNLPTFELNKLLKELQTKTDKRIKTVAYVGDAEHQNKNLWLLKPTGYNRGIGIHVFNSVDDLKSILWNHYRINVYALNQGINVDPKEAAVDTE